MPSAGFEPKTFTSVERQRAISRDMDWLISATTGGDVLSIFPYLTGQSFTLRYECDLYNNVAKTNRSPWAFPRALVLIGRVRNTEDNFRTCRSLLRLCHTNGATAVLGCLMAIGAASSFKWSIALHGV